jgi:predicted NAD/FAD-binding protein
MRAFPALSFFRFFENHGLLDLANRPQWRTVVGGSRSYVRRLAGDLEGRWQTRRAASCVRRTERGVEVYSGGEREAFDEVVLACHADEALRLLDDPSRDEARFLGAFGYQRNRTLLHTDPMLMTRRRSVWSSWNYIARSDGEATREVSVSYWMNRLHRLQQAPDIFVSLNPLREPRAEHRVRELDYMHPVFDQAAVRAQSILGELQGRNRLWFCGAYTGYGFHEDALRSAVGVAQALGVQAPWEDSPARAPARPAPAMTGEAVLP